VAKKNKIQKRVPKPVTARTGVTTRRPTPLQIAAENSLIVFDRKTKVFLLLLVVLYFVMSFFDLHTSSIAIWDQMFGTEDPPSLLAGTPEGVRQDEWMVNTPSLIGQVQSGMPLSNTAFGDGSVPIILGFPVKDIGMILRPSLWPYFIFDIQRAFAFSWNFNIFFFIISTFLLLMILTKSSFWISVLGSIFIFLSGAMQWWSYWLGSYMIYLNGIFISIVFLLYGKHAKALLLSGVVFLICGYNFLVGLYPPWQVPLFYLYVAIIIGFVLQKGDFVSIKKKVWMRAGIGVAAILALGIFAYHYYGLVKHTYDILLNTSYPGRRTTNGGDLVKGKLFSEFFGMYMTGGNCPQIWLNICEASNFIMFFPILFYCFGYYYIKLKKIDWVEILISIYIIVLLIWVLLGFPSFLSKISLMSMSPAYRSLPVLGVANCILLFYYLGNGNTEQKARFSWIEFVILGISVFIFVKVVATKINEATTDFFTPEQVMLASILITAAYLLIRYSYFRYSKIVLGVLLLGLTITNIKVHPLTVGLSSLLENPLVKSTKEPYKSDPAARWAVFGNQKVANLLKVNGIKFFNGVKAVPILSDMKVLDSSGKDKFIYNRFAHIVLTTFINGKDSVRFKLNENEVVNDNYSIYMDPCSPRLERLGVKYFVFTYKPQDIEVRCLSKINETNGIFVYKRKGP
jgi:hypothetical protein